MRPLMLLALVAVGLSLPGSSAEAAAPSLAITGISCEGS